MKPVEQKIFNAVFTNVPLNANQIIRRIKSAHNTGTGHNQVNTAIGYLTQYKSLKRTTTESGEKFYTKTRKFEEAYSLHTNTPLDIDNVTRIMRQKWSVSGYNIAEQCRLAVVA